MKSLRVKCCSARCEALALHQYGRRLLPAPSLSRITQLRCATLDHYVLLHHHSMRPSPTCSVVASSAGADLPHHHPPNTSQKPPSTSVWARCQSNAAEMKAQVAKLGLAAILAYGLFDGITYTTFFVLAFFGYEKSTGKNPTANIQALLAIVILMWTGNNVTRPLRVAGAAALAPVVDKALRKIQRTLNLPNQVFAFMVVVATFAALCLSVVGLLILSRWGK